MKRLLFLTICLLCAVPPLFSDSPGGMIQGSYANVREDAAFNARIVGRKIRGDTYTVIFEKDDWRRVRFEDGLEGWIFQTLLERKVEYTISEETEGVELDDIDALTAKQPSKEDEELEFDDELEKLKLAELEKEKEKAAAAKKEAPPPKVVYHPDTPYIPTKEIDPAKILEISSTAEELYNQAIELYERREYKKALEKNREALKKAPHNAEILNNIANCLFKMGKIQEALDHWKEALKITPKSGKISNNIGIANYQLDRNQQALEYYQKAIIFEPDFPDPYYNLGSVYGFIGRFDDAIKNYQKFLEFDSDETMKKLAEERIRYCELQIANQ